MGHRSLRDGRNSTFRLTEEPAERCTERSNLMDIENKTSKQGDRRAWWILSVSTLAFAICFAAWMLNGVLVTFLVDNGLFDWGPQEIGWLIGIPVLSGALFRLPFGIATDRWGGRAIFTLLLFFVAVPMFLLSYCTSFWQFFIASFCFGFVGASFAIGIAYTSSWFSNHQQGTALGIFGAGNAGAAITMLIAPHLLNWLTENGENLEGWRQLPQIYAFVLLITGIVFFLTTTTRIDEGQIKKTLSTRLRVLYSARVWRFGLYYFFVFGGFVALSQWLIPYYVNVYSTTVVMAGVLVAIFSFPSGVIRALGGWMSDRWGARIVLYWVFAISVVSCILLIVPQMDIRAPGSGVMARRSGIVTSMTANSITIDSQEFGGITYPIQAKQGELISNEERQSGLLFLPRSTSWQESVVDVGQSVNKKELIARGITHIFFQANIWIFTFLCFLIGSVMGIGKAAVYKHIPNYFPDDVGVVGGMVGVIGGLGGFVCPVLFGYFLDATGLWTTCWMFFVIIAVLCLLWMHRVIQHMIRRDAPQLFGSI